MVIAPLAAALYKARLAVSFTQAGSAWSVAWVPAFGATAFLFSEAYQKGYERNPDRYYPWDI
jgi:hypothetical protein